MGAKMDRTGRTLLDTMHRARPVRQAVAKPTFIQQGKVSCALIAALVLPALAFAGQQSLQGPFSVHVETQLVQVHVRVVGKDNKPVTGLKKGDFSVKENGRRREVTTLDYISAPESVQTIQQKPQTAAATGQASSRKVWIYIDSEVDSDEVTQAYQAIKQFLTSQFQPGFMVSLDGLPFTGDQASLLATLEKMRRGPFGHLPDVPPLINPVLDMEKQADYEWLLYSALLWGGGAVAPPPGFASLNMGGGFSSGPHQTGLTDLKLDMKNTELEMSFYVRSALFRYLDIIYHMEALQGEKMVVIFRSGLRLDSDTMALLHEFAATAMRHQISFYTVDSRGLFNIDPTTNRAKLLRYGVPIPQWNISSPMQFQAALDDYTRTAELANGRMEGLIDIAHMTGGKSVTKTNDLDEVFKDVVADASGYYVVGFYPVNQRQAGRFRRLKIAVNLPGVTVDAPRGYYEPQPFKELSKHEKEVILWRALQSEMPRDLPAEATVNVFRGENGQPEAVVSTGVRLGALVAKHKKEISEVHVTELAEIKAASGDTLPTYHGQNANIQIADSVFSQASASPTEFVTFNTKMVVSPGKHICKVVFRDDNTGRLGAEQVQFNAPDYGSAPSVSTLLVTHHVTPSSAGGSSGKPNSGRVSLSGLLQAGGMDFVPQPESEFYAGDKIYFLYEIYNPPSYDFDTLASSARTKLLRNGIPIRQFNINWRILPDPKLKLAKFIGTLDTDRFLMGDYQVLQAVPMECGTDGKLSAQFMLDLRQ